MVGMFVIPVASTDNINCEYERDISCEELGRLSLSHINETYNGVSNLVNHIMNGDNRERKSNYRDNLRYEIENPTNAETYVDKTVFIDYECEAYIQDSERNDIEESKIIEYNDNGKMFILIVNINPTRIDNDAESELRFWFDDSKKVHKDKRLDDETKLKALPKRNFKIILNEEKYLLKNCKLIERYTENERKYPFHFAIIVEKLIKE